MIKNLNALQLVESLVKTEYGVERLYFVEGYWLDIIKYDSEEKERFRFLDENNIVRVWYDELLNTFEVNRRYVRFFNVNEVYLNSEEKKDKRKEINREMGNVVVFYGLVPVKKTKDSESEDGKSIGNLDDIKINNVRRKISILDMTNCDKTI